MKRLFTVLLLLGTLGTQSAAAREHRLTIGNNEFACTIQTHGDRIRAASLFDKATGC